MKIRHLLILAALGLATALSPTAWAQQNGVWNAGSGNYQSTGNWVETRRAQGDGASATFNPSGSTINVAVGQNFQIGSIIVNGTSGQLNLRGPNTFTLINAGETPVLHAEGAGLAIDGVVLAGSSGFEKTGAGMLSFTAATAHTFTGDIILSDGIIRSYTANVLGNRTIRANGANTQWHAEARAGEGTHESNVVLGTDSFAIAGTGGSGTPSDTLLTGTISETGGSRSISYYNSADGADRIKRFVVSGDNSYTGDTIIGRDSRSETIVRITHDNALGAGDANVEIVSSTFHDANTLELSGGVTITGKTLTLAGRGQQGQGSLQSIDGDNTWAGDVNLGSHEAPTIGVADASRFTIDGIISGSATGADGFVKEGKGTLILSRNNTYSGPTTVQDGTMIINGNHTGNGLIVVKENARLGGNGSVASGLNVLGTIGAGDGLTTFSAESLSLGATSTLAVQLGRTPEQTYQSSRIAVSGPVVIQPGANLSLTMMEEQDSPMPGDIVWIITSSGSDAVSGIFTHLNGTLTNLSEGSHFLWNSRTWAITYQADFDSLSFSGGNDIALQVVIPEPHSVTLIGLVTGAGLLLCRRKREQPQG